MTKFETLAFDTLLDSMKRDGITLHCIIEKSNEGFILRQGTRDLFKFHLTRCSECREPLDQTLETFTIWWRGYLSGREATLNKAFDNPGHSE